MLILDTNNNLGFTQYLADAALLFSDTLADEEMTGVTLSCLDQVRVDFKDTYDNPLLADVPASGLKVDFQALYDDCKAELDEFKVDIETEMQAQIDGYSADALKQEHKAKADLRGT